MDYSTGLDPKKISHTWLRRLFCFDKLFRLLDVVDGVSTDNDLPAADKDFSAADDSDLSAADFSGEIPSADSCSAAAFINSENTSSLSGLNSKKKGQIDHRNSAKLAKISIVSEWESLWATL